MDSKNRLSMDSINPGSGSSALRRLTRSPSHRISLRRFSIESSSSSASSVVSYDSEASSSCVTRDTSSDDCALHRFIVWAAVKRNASDKLTPQEKLECPMLRCRKRFANHELMLQHLYSCSWLSTSEYWCYDCGKSERFNDSKCKRCLGHPSRRRKILSMAKNFFNSLGHKSKHATLPDFDLDLDLGDPEAPPSYDLAVSPNELELPSNEIHEIGSSGLALHPIIEDEHESEAEPDLAPIPTPYMSSLAAQNRALPNHPAELESDAAPGEPFDFMFPPGTVHPISLTDTGCNTALARPTLQLQIAGLEDYRREQKRRSKGQVAPSTSVRSTASTNSTSSTNTTDTTFSKESYNISPISTYSADQWASAPVFDSDFSSSENGFGGPGGLLRTNSFAISRKAPAAKGWGSLDEKADSSYDSHPREFPTDFPILGALPSSNTFHDPLALDQPVFTLNDSSLPADFDLESNLALTNNNAVMSPSMTSTLPQPTVSSYHNPRSLIGTIWSTLRVHVADSLSKLDHITKNPLVTQLKSLPTETIAANGLKILVDIIEGREPSVPINILCFVHLGYCFSLVAHEQDAANRSAELFGQAMSYSTLFPREDRQMYIQVVKALWKPAAMTDADVVNIVRAKTSSSVSRSSNLKGKEHEFSNMHEPDADSLVFAAKYFLDQLELATLNVVDDAVINTSQLYMDHLTIGMHIDSQQAAIASLILKNNFQYYTHYRPFVTGLNSLVQRINSDIISARRLELQLIEIGKMSLPPHVYFDGYIRHVREQMGPLYFKNATGGNLRSAYYCHGVELIKTIIAPPLQLMNTQQMQDDGLPDSVMDYAFDEELEFFNNSTASETFNFGGNLPFDAGQPLNYLDLSNSINTGTLNSQPLPTPADTSSVQATPAAANSPSAPAPASSSASTAKIKSDVGCTLCSYTPKGDPRWFSCSLSKHMRLQHSTKPPVIYRCQYPGCTSQYKNRPDNLRQHQIEKGHFTDGQDAGKRSNKRRKVD